MFCPNFNNIEVVDKFNSLIELMKGKPMTIAEFKDSDLRNKRKGNDLLAINFAYGVWDRYKGENIPNSLSDILKGKKLEEIPDEQVKSQTEDI